MVGFSCRKIAYNILVNRNSTTLPDYIQLQELKAHSVSVLLNNNRSLNTFMLICLSSISSAACSHINRTENPDANHDISE